MTLEGMLNAAKSMGLEQEEVVRRVQERYADYVREGWLENLKALREVTGVELSEEVYKALIDSIDPL